MKSGTKPPLPLETLIKHDEKTKGNLYPSISMQTTIITERDLHFIWKMKQIRESKIAVITGMAHVHGILKMWDETIDLDLLLNVDNPQIIAEGMKLSTELHNKYFSNSDSNTSSES
jgi:hypothetical protein